MGQTVLTCLTFKPPGPPPHEKLYGCGLYFASFLPGKQWSRLLSLLQEKPACVSCALGGHGRAFITELRQTLAGLWSHDKLIIPCEFPEKALKLWEWVREPLLANTGLIHCRRAMCTERFLPAVPARPPLPGLPGMHSGARGLCTTRPGTRPGTWPGTRPGTPPRAETAPPMPTAGGHTVQPSFQGSSRASSIRSYSPALPQCSAMRSRIREPGHNQTDFLWNTEEPGGWGMIRMVSNPRGCSCAWWTLTAPAGSKEMNRNTFLKPTLTVSTQSLTLRSREINSSVAITPIKMMKKHLWTKNAHVSAVHYQCLGAWEGPRAQHQHRGCLHAVQLHLQVGCVWSAAGILKRGTGI